MFIFVIKTIKADDFMKVIILAAGYATRMYPLTKNYPKALLKVDNYNTILDLVIKDIQEQDITVVTNSRFNIYFDVWKVVKPNITLINDGTNTPETKLGVIKDLQLALQDVDEDVLVMAADSVLDFDINQFIDFAKDSYYSCCMTYKEKDLHKLQKTGVGEILNGVLINLQEKPYIPKTQHAIPPFYVFKQKDLDFIRNYTAETDHLGNLLQALCQKTVVKCFDMPGHRVDYGTLEQFEHLIQDFDEIAL